MDVAQHRQQVGARTVEPGDAHLALVLFAGGPRLRGGRSARCPRRPARRSAGCACHGPSSIARSTGERRRRGPEGGDEFAMPSLANALSPDGTRRKPAPTRPLVAARDLRVDAPLNGGSRREGREGLLLTLGTNRARCGALSNSVDKVPMDFGLIGALCAKRCSLGCLPLVNLMRCEASG